MEEYSFLRECSPGDEVRVRTVLDHKAALTHVNYVFRNQQDEGGQVVIGYKVPPDSQQHDKNSEYIRT